MKVSAISIGLMAFTFGVAAPVCAQQAGVDERQKEADAKPETPAPGAFPVEDPTIQLEREPDLTVREGDPGAETPEVTPAAPLAQADEDAAEEPTAGELPVEDPTIDQRAEIAEEPTEGERAPKKPQGPEEDQGAKVKVFYEQGFLVAVDDWFYLALAGLVQARYTVDYRTRPPTDSETGIREKQVTEGFDVARARFQLGIGLTQFVALYMRIGVVAGGNFGFQRAFIDLKWKFFRVRAGLFMNETDAESLVNPEDLYMVDYSIAQNVYDPGSSKGVMFTYLRRRFSINLGYSDGLRTGFAAFRAPVRADFAVSLRAQYAWGKAGLSGFNRLTSRRGTPFGVRLGAALHYQDGGRSQGTLPVKIALGTIDLSLRGGGWSLLLTVTAGQDATNANAMNEAGELVSSAVALTGGYFVLENLQVFGRYSIVTKPTIQGVLPANLPNDFSLATSNFQAFGVGLSYFVVPGRNNIKLTSDFQYFLGYQQRSIVPSSPLNSIQPNDAGSQLAWRIQLTAAF